MKTIHFKNKAEFNRQFPKQNQYLSGKSLYIYGAELISDNLHAIKIGSSMSIRNRIDTLSSSLKKTAKMGEILVCKISASTNHDAKKFSKLEKVIHSNLSAYRLAKPGKHSIAVAEKAVIEHLGDFSGNSEVFDVPLSTLVTQIFAVYNISDK